MVNYDDVWSALWLYDVELAGLRKEHGHFGTFKAKGLELMFLVYSNRVVVEAPNYAPLEITYAALKNIEDLIAGITAWAERLDGGLPATVAEFFKRPGTTEVLPKKDLQKRLKE